MLSAVVLSFSRLHLGQLGCYGNDWVETPNLDRLATQAVVFDRHFAEDVDPLAANHAWWTGKYLSLIEPEAQRELPAFFEQLPADVKSWLFVESDGADASFVAPRFDEIISVGGVDSLDAAEDETPYARLVLKLVERLPVIAAGPERSLLWIKARGVPNPWLPPRGFADLYLDEFGLSGNPADVEDDDAEAQPDSVIEQKYARALYAAYVSWLDRWTGKLLRTLEVQPGWNETLLIVTAAAGESLGEHAPIGEAPLPLREEVLHTPLIVRLPDRRHDATRRRALVQPPDVPATLLDWFGVEFSRRAAVHTEAVPLETGFCNAAPASEGSNIAVDSSSLLTGLSLLPLLREEADSIREVAFSSSAGEWGLRTDDFFLVEPRNLPISAEPPDALLFEKPQDRWDQADLAKQYPQIVEELHQDLRKIPQ